MVPEIDAAQRLVDAMAGIEPGPALDTLAARQLARLSPEIAARALAVLVGGASCGPHQRKAANALCRALLWGGADLDDLHRGAIRAAAHSLGLGWVVALFTEGSAALAFDPDARRVDPEIGSLTLGHRKQMARTESDRDRITRLTVDDDRSVIQNLLQNPRMTEDLVVRIAARRPAPEEVLEEVARSQRWSLRRGVRRALALNPYAPPTLVNPLLPHLIAGDLAEVAASMALHPAVRSAARALLGARRS
ncbi:MAG: hypothetical protein EXR72_12870 [Myxococcales bacterium]|nr:hypothetical protein [Myxococcales bacterium]